MVLFFAARGVFLRAAGASTVRPAGAAGARRAAAGYLGGGGGGLLEEVPGRAPFSFAANAIAASATRLARPAAARAREQILLPLLQRRLLLKLLRRRHRRRHRRRRRRALADEGGVLLERRAVSVVGDDLEVVRRRRGDRAAAPIIAGVGARARLAAQLGGERHGAHGDLHLAHGPPPRPQQQHLLPPLAEGLF